MPFGNSSLSLPPPSFSKKPADLLSVTICFYFLEVCKNGIIRHVLFIFFLVQLFRTTIFPSQKYFVLLVCFAIRLNHVSMGVVLKQHNFSLYFNEYLLYSTRKLMQIISCYTIGLRYHLTQLLLFLSKAGS